MNDKEMLKNKDKMMPGGGVSWHKFEEPSWKILTTFPSPLKSYGEVTLSTNEMTALCPLTGFPDQYKLFITYVPRRVCVESKSAKFYFGAYRDFPGFLETITQKLFDDFTKAANPIYLKVDLEMNPRGGVAIRSILERKWKE